jgi:hypothetical protein
VAAPSARFAARTFDNGNRYVLETRRSRWDARVRRVALGMTECIDNHVHMSIHVDDRRAAQG